MRVIIQSPELTPRQSLIDLVNKKIRKLEHFSDRIQEARVLLKLDRSSLGADKICEVQLVIPGNDLFAKRQAETFDEAASQAADALRAQVNSWNEKVKEKR